MNNGSNIYVAGGDTIVGAAILRVLREKGRNRIANDSGREPDLQNPFEVEEFFLRESPEYVFFAAGRSGGIHANQSYPADLIRDNVLSVYNVLHSAWRTGVRKLLYLGSSCSYPRECPQPMRVESLMTGPLEPTNEAYATAKLAGIAVCRAYRQQHGAYIVSAIPANVFGPGDDFSPENSHVIAALLRRMHEARRDKLPEVMIWGTGAPIRDFIFSDDLAEACLFLMSRYEDPTPINVGTGMGMSIREIAEMIREIVGFRGCLFFDADKPDGMPVKVLDNVPIRSLGWTPRTSLRDALLITYEWFLQYEEQGGSTA
jgi:GDP-L-fucose synthase